MIHYKGDTIPGGGGGGYLYLVIVCLASVYWRPLQKKRATKIII
jgi:hypothetical protein